MSIDAKESRVRKPRPTKTEACVNRIETLPKHGESRVAGHAKVGR